MRKDFGQMIGMEDLALEYIRHVMATKGWNAAELAKRAGVSHSTINRPLTTPGWKSKVSRSTLEKIAAASGILPTDAFQTPLMGAGAPPDDLVPIYNVQASAGGGLTVGDEYVVDRLSFPPGYLRRITKSDPRNLAIIGVKGDSMIPTLKDDDVVMVDTSKRDLSWGGIFVIKVDGDGLLVKRVSMGSQRGFFKIVSDNAAAFPPVERRSDEVEVVGRVIWYGVKV